MLSASSAAAHRGPSPSRFEAEFVAAPKQQHYWKMNPAAKEATTSRPPNSLQVWNEMSESMLMDSDDTATQRAAQQQRLQFLLHHQHQLQKHRPRPDTGLPRQGMTAEEILSHRIALRASTIANAQPEHGDASPANRDHCPRAEPLCDDKENVASPEAERQPPVQLRGKAAADKEGTKERPKVAVRSMQWLIRMIDDIYTARHKELAQCDVPGGSAVMHAQRHVVLDDLYSSNTRPSAEAPEGHFAYWVAQYLAKRFGLETLVKQSSFDLCSSCRSFASVSTQAEVFKLFLASDLYDNDDLAFFLSARALVTSETPNSHFLCLSQHVTVDGAPHVLPRRFLPERRFTVLTKKLLSRYQLNCALFRRLLAHPSNLTDIERQVERQGYLDANGLLKALLLAYKEGKTARPCAGVSASTMELSAAQSFEDEISSPPPAGATARRRSLPSGGGRSPRLQQAGSRFATPPRTPQKAPRAQPPANSGNNPSPSRRRSGQRRQEPSAAVSPTAGLPLLTPADPTSPLAVLPPEVQQAILATLGATGAAGAAGSTIHVITPSFGHPATPTDPLPAAGPFDWPGLAAGWQQHTIVMPSDASSVTESSTAADPEPFTPPLPNTTNWVYQQPPEDQSEGSVWWMQEAGGNEGAAANALQHVSEAYGGVGDDAPGLAQQVDGIQQYSTMLNKYQKKGEKPKSPSKKEKSPSPKKKGAGSPKKGGRQPSREELLLKEREDSLLREQQERERRSKRQAEVPEDIAERRRRNMQAFEQLAATPAEPLVDDSLGTEEVASSGLDARKAKLIREKFESEAREQAYKEKLQRASADKKPKSPPSKSKTGSPQNSPESGAKAAQKDPKKKAVALPPREAESDRDSPATVPRDMRGQPIDAVWREPSPATVSDGEESVRDVMDSSSEDELPPPAVLAPSVGKPVNPANATQPTVTRASGSQPSSPRSESSRSTQPPAGAPAQPQAARPTPSEPSTTASSPSAASGHTPVPFPIPVAPAVMNAAGLNPGGAGRQRRGASIYSRDGDDQSPKLPKEPEGAQKDKKTASPKPPPQQQLGKQDKPAENKAQGLKPAEGRQRRGASMYKAQSEGDDRTANVPPPPPPRHEGGLDPMSSDSDSDDGMWGGGDDRSEPLTADSVIAELAKLRGNKGADNASAAETTSEDWKDWEAGPRSESDRLTMDDSEEGTLGPGADDSDLRVESPVTPAPKQVPVSAAALKPQAKLAAGVPSAALTRMRPSSASQREPIAEATSQGQQDPSLVVPAVDIVLTPDTLERDSCGSAHVDVVGQPTQRQDFSASVTFDRRRKSLMDIATDEAL